MIYKTIRRLIREGILAEPFRVDSVQRVSNVLARSPSFISKHAIGNPGGYTEYFERVGPGLYRLIEQYGHNK